MTSIEFLRQFRVGGYAVADFLATFLLLILLAPYLSKLFLKIKIHIPKRSWLIWALPLAILVHLLVGAMTPMTTAFIS